jgi:hypothetical protein
MTGGLDDAALHDAWMRWSICFIEKGAEIRS